MYFYINATHHIFLGIRSRDSGPLLSADAKNLIFIKPEFKKCHSRKDARKHASGLEISKNYFAFKNVTSVLKQKQSSKEQLGSLSMNKIHCTTPKKNCSK
jgi:hypothetical protein